MSQPTKAQNPADVAEVAIVATPPPTNCKIEAFRHGVSVAGHPLTWTGRIVSLDEWRRLSEWQRHGPDGLQWCGINRKWIESEDT